METHKVYPQMFDICSTIAHMVLEDICDTPIRIQSYCAAARLYGV
jgi:hypothetical protein